MARERGYEEGRGGSTSNEIGEGREGEEVRGIGGVRVEGEREEGKG